MKRISIIIPVFKVESYIGKCIESILSQSYTNFELLLIDDGSPDRSGEICDSFLGKDSRIKVFHIPNGGPSNARNLGLTWASGDYVCFIDSDDWVEKDFLKHLVENLFDESIGVVIAGHIRDGKTAKVKTHEEKTYLKENFDTLCDETRLYNWGFSHDKLYNLKVIKENNLSFPVQIKFSEDLIFLLKYIKLCDWVHFVPYADYHYIIPQGHKSLIASYNSFESEYQCYRLTRECIEDLSGNMDNPKSKSWATYMLMRAVKTQYRKGKHFLGRKERMSNLKNVITREDVSFASKYSMHNLTIDKITLSLIIKNCFSVADFCLRAFFWLRYSPLTSIINKSR